MTKELSFTCPICGTKKAYPINKMVKGALLECPHCSLKLTLHGHMWEEVEQQIGKIRKGQE
jgi:transcription elongation factor Elf1